MRKNAALAKWRAGQQTIGGWLSMNNAFSAETMANAGFDWLCIDMQHGLIDYGDLRHMLPAISTTDTTPMVRVAGHDPAMIMKVLDAGAMGVIVPLVNTRAEAEMVVAACKYPPKGNRSFGPIRAAMYGGRGYVQEADDEIVCIAMIETKDGLANLEEIVTTPGLGGIYVGPADLSYALGLPPVGDNEVPIHVETVAKILATCKKHKVPAGIHTGGLEYTQKRLEAGFDFVTLASDGGLIAQGAAVALAAARGTVEKQRERSGY